MGEQERRLEAEKNPDEAVEILKGIREGLKIPEKMTVSEFMRKKIILKDDTIVASIKSEDGIKYFLGNNDYITIGNLEKILGHYSVNIPETIGIIKMQIMREHAKKQPNLIVPGHTQGNNGKNRIEGV